MFDSFLGLNLDLPVLSSHQVIPLPLSLSSPPLLQVRIGPKLLLVSTTVIQLPALSLMLLFHPSHLFLLLVSSVLFSLATVGRTVLYVLGSGLCNHMDTQMSSLGLFFLSGMH